MIGHPPDPRRKRKPRRIAAVTNRQKILVLSLLLVLGGLYLYGTIITHDLINALAGHNLSADDVRYYSKLVAWSSAFMLVFMVLGLVMLVLFLVEELVHWRQRRQPARCPRCGATEAPNRPKFARERVEGTGWDNRTCPLCDHTWYTRS